MPGGDYAWEERGRGPYMVVVCIECQGGEYAWEDGERGERRAIHGGGMH